MCKDFINRVRRKWMNLRLRPIRVYCLHHVCEEFDAESMNAGDWMQIDKFRNKVLALQQDEAEFISLSDAYRHICMDKIRLKKYAVLTFDDGYASLKEILPWLEKQQIPVVLFINGKYLDGKSYRKTPKEQYLTKEELFAMSSPLLEISSHGWEHIRATEQTENEFEKSVEMNETLLRKHTRYIPFHAYTYGDHNAVAEDVLNQKSIVPVLIDGMKNYNDRGTIHRELFEV